MCGTAAAREGQFVQVSQRPAFDTDFTVAAEKTINSVVCIKSYVTTPARQRGQQQYMSPFGMDPFEFFFGTPQQQAPRRGQREQNQEPVQSGLGSGVIISADGYIVTNNHVIDGAERLEILMNDNSTYDAIVIGTDETTDLALLKIDAEGLQSIRFGNSDDLKVGEWVLAVGNPFGFNSTVTAGIVSAKARSIGSGSHGSRIGLDSYIQTDAALNPGNSGGALVNLNGELVGINSAIYSNTGSYTGYSFAIPTTVVHKIVEDLRQYGAVQRAVLGVTISELTAKTAKEKGITTTNSGLLVVSVEDRSTAKEMGLKPDDVITEVNGVEVHNMAQLMEQMNKFSPGDQISLTFIRDNKRVAKSGTLRNNQGNTSITKKGDFTELGCAFLKLTDENKKQFGISYGVKVAGLKDGIFRDYDIPEGFIIQEINGERVNSEQDVERIYNAIMNSNDADRVMFITGIYPTGKRGYKAVDLTTE